MRLAVTQEIAGSSPAPRASSLSATVENHSWPRASVPALVEHDSAIHDHILDATRITVRLFIRGIINHCIRIEYRDVGGQARTQQPAVELTNLRRVCRSHFSD